MLKYRALAAGLLVIILVIAGFLRFYRSAYADGLTFDEVWHVELAEGRGSTHEQVPTDELVSSAMSVTSRRDAPSPLHVFTHLDHVTHPPLFFFLLRCWVDLWNSNSDNITQSFSIVLGLLAIAMLFDAVWVSSDGSVVLASLAAIVMAVAPAQIYMHQEVRGYALAQCFGSGLIASIIRIKAGGINARRLAGVFLCTLGIALSHYFGIFASLAMGAYVMFEFRGRVRRDTMIALVAAGAVFALLWGPSAWAQRGEVGSTADTFLMEQHAGHLAALVQTLGRMCSAAAYQVFAPPLPGQRWTIVVGLLMICPTFILWRRRPDLRIWFFWLCGTLFFVTLLDATRGTRQLLFPRYTAMGMPALCAMTAMVFAPFRKSPFLRALPATLLTLAALYFFDGAYHPFTRGESEWRPLSAFLESRLSPGSGRDGSRIDHANAAPAEPVIYMRGGMNPTWHNRVLYLTTSHYAPRAFPRPIVLLSRNATPELIASFPTRSAWLVVTSPPQYFDAREILPGSKIVEEVVFRNTATAVHVVFPISGTKPSM